MADLIIVRLHPKDPTDGASFTGYLDGLTINVYDRSFKDPRGTQALIGSASFDNPSPTGVIVQHAGAQGLYAVASAIIQVPTTLEPPAYAEYKESDLRLTITRTSTPPPPAPPVTRTIVDTSASYNVAFASGVVPGANDFASAMAFTDVAMYLALPPGGVGVDADPSTASIDLPADGSPPPFADLLAAVTTVLEADPGGNPDVSRLTAEQCRHIAREILSNRALNPLPVPAPPATLETLYTTLAPNVPSNADDARRQFEGALTSYTATLSTRADVLAKYVFALSAAIYANEQSKNASRAGFRFPVLPGVAGSPDTDVILSS